MYQQCFIGAIVWLIQSPNAHNDANVYNACAIFVALKF